MAFMHPHLSRSEASWLRSAPVSQSTDDFLDLVEVPVPSARREWRRRAMKIFGCTCLVALCAIGVWTAQSPAARGAIASWGTMGTTAQARLGATLAHVDSEQHELTLELGPIAWASAPPLAVPERDTEAMAPAPAPVPVSWVAAVPVPGSKPSSKPADDPYADTPVPPPPAGANSPLSTLPAADPDAQVPRRKYMPSEI